MFSNRSICRYNTSKALPLPFETRIPSSLYHQAHSTSASMSAPLKAGDPFPEGVKFEWAPITDPDPKACGMPQDYNASEEFKGKKVHFTQASISSLTSFAETLSRLSSSPSPAPSPPVAKPTTSLPTSTSTPS